MKTPSTIGRLLGDLEREVMRVVWKHASGVVTIREVMDTLATRGAAYTTVMTIMNRLVAKGLLTKREEGNAHIYRPRITEREFLRSVAGKFMTRIHKEFGPVAIASFVEEAAKRHRTKLRSLLRRLPEA